MNPQKILKFVTAGENDKQYFSSLNVLVYKDLVTQQLGSWDSEYERVKFDKKWTEQQFQKIYLNGQLVGGWWIDKFDSYWQLREIQIHPDYQSDGIGTLLMGLLVDRSTQLGKSVRLRVLTSNPSVSLYKRSGFKVVGENKTQYMMRIDP